MAIAQFKAAADATPQSGSTTQSSNDLDRVGIEDAAAVSLINGQISLTIKNSGSGVTWDEISTGVTSNLRRDTAGHHLQLEKATSNGILYLNTFTDIERTTTETEEIIPESESVMVGSNILVIRDLAMVDGVRGEIICGATECDFDINRDMTYETEGVFLNVNSYFFIREGSTTRTPIQNGQAFFELGDEVEINGVLGTLAVVPNEDCFGGCLWDGEFLDESGNIIASVSFDRAYDYTIRITDVEGTWSFNPYSSEIRTVSIVDTDYLVGGTWIHIPNGEGENIEIGAFADGSQPLTNLRPFGTARYSGDAFGVRLEITTYTEFSADVVLNADFDEGTIDGMITGTDLPSDLILGEATFNTTGIFNDGTTSITGGYTGNWGGQFYGDGATSAAGTFGASKGTAGETDFDSFVGYFGANVD